MKNVTSSRPKRSSAHSNQRPSCRSAVPKVANTVALPLVVDLGQPAEVVAAAVHSGPVYWIADQRPALLVGALVDEFQGAWIENGKAYCQLGKHAAFQVPMPPELSLTGRREFLRDLVVQALSAPARGVRAAKKLDRHRAPFHVSSRIV